MTAQGTIVGIDLGTSNSCAATVGPDGVPVVLADEHGQAIIPSVVSFHPNGSILVGAAAKERRVIDPHNTVSSIKRILGRPASAHEVAALRERTAFTIAAGPNDQAVVSTRAGSFAATEISAIVLDHLRRLAEAALDTKVDRAIITVPANFNDAQRQATAAAGAIAGLAVERVLNEPTAAALAYGHGRSLSQTVAVYDFGGGTFDVTVLALRGDVYEVLATAGDSCLGGDDIDMRLVERMTQAFLNLHRIDLRSDEQAMQRLRAAAEMAKCELSSEARTVVEVPAIARGAGGAPLDLRVSVTREALVKCAADLIERSLAACDETLRLASLAATQVDEVVLVGGTTRIPYLRERVAAFFGRPPRTDVNPDEAVALGAALMAASLGSAPAPRRATAPPGPSRRALGAVDLAAVAEHDGLRLAQGSSNPLPARLPAARAERPTAADMLGDITRAAASPRPVLLDVTPRGLAIATVGGYCDEIISRNTQVPSEQARVFTTAHDGQSSVEIRIYEGEARRQEDNALLGTLVLCDIPARPRGAARIHVTFEIDTNGILRVQARDQETNKAQSLRIELFGAQSAEEIDASRKRLQGLREAPGA